MRDAGASPAAAAPAGDTDQTAAIGTDDQSDASVTLALGAQSIGGDAASDLLVSLLLAGAVGTDTASDAPTDDSGSGTGSQGTDDASMGATDTGTLTDGLGSDAESLAANSTITAVGWASSTSVQNNGGSNTWTSPTNAEGDTDGTEASISAAASPTSGDDYDAELRFTGFDLGQAPSGWTRDKVELVITHRWDLSVGVLSTANTTITVRDSGGTLLGTPVDRDENTGNQATLLEETFDITSAVSGLSEAQLAAVQIWCEATCNLLIVTGGTASWQVDSCHVQTTYSRTGFS